MDAFIEHEARFVAPDHGAVDGRRLTRRSVIVTTGSHPTTTPIMGIEEAGYPTNVVEAPKLRRLPRSMVVVGSGPIGSEPPRPSRFGSKASLDSSPRPLPEKTPRPAGRSRGP